MSRTCGGAPASSALTITCTPATCSAGSASSQRAGPPSRASVARADARSAAADSATSLASPVDPEVAMTTAEPRGAVAAPGVAPRERGRTGGPPPNASASASMSVLTRSGDPSSSTDCSATPRRPSAESVVIEVEPTTLVGGYGAERRNKPSEHGEV